MPIKDIIKEAEVKMKNGIEAAKREFSEVRTGRAHPGLIESLKADYFGTPTLIREMASISTPDPRTIAIQPWDATAIEEIEKAINNSHLGLSPSNDGKIVRLTVPQLSEERREELKKLVKEMAEKSRVEIRTSRREANDKLKKLESDKAVSKDDGFKAHEEVQKLTDKYIKEIDHLLDDKSKALMEV